MEEFNLTKNHIRLLKHAYVGWDNCEFGAPSIDCKRPYGNSDVLDDMKKIILSGLDEEAYEAIGDKLDDWLMNLHAELKIALQIVLVTGKFEPGVYEQKESYMVRSWNLKKEE